MSVANTDQDRYLLELKDLRKEYQLRVGLFGQLVGRASPKVRAVDGINLKIRPGEVLALVGESGSGKTTLGKLTCLLERPTAGSIVLDGRDVTNIRGRELKRFRREVQMIFQNPYESLDRRYTIGATVMEPLALHRIGTLAERKERAIEALAQVELRPAERYFDRYPQDLSGGQRQRVAIARALVLEPRLIVADEPVSMLDVSIRSGIMKLMEDLRVSRGISYLYVTHDLAVARYVSDRMAVMYLGKVVEEGPTEELVRAAAHPYTRLLLAAVPGEGGANRKRVVVKGDIESSRSVTGGCRFRSRCPLAQEVCKEREPALAEVSPDRWAACHFASEVVARPGLDPADRREGMRA